MTKGKTMGQLAEEFELKAPKFLAKYIKEGQCNCRVCLCLAYLANNGTSNEAGMRWLNEGLELEYDLYAKKISKKEYDSHHSKKTLDNYIEQSKE